MILNSRVFGVFPREASAAKYRLQGTVIGSDGNAKPSKIAVFRELSAVGGHKEPPGYEQVRVLRTNAAGEYTVVNLPPSKHTLIAYDKSGEFDPVIKGGLMPEPME